MVSSNTLATALHLWSDTTAFSFQGMQRMRPEDPYANEEWSGGAPRDLRSSTPARSAVLPARAKDDSKEH